MPYTDISIDDLIVLSIEFVSRGVSLPQEIREILGDSLSADIEHPENQQHGHQEY